jgi:hypothetical protein
MGVDMTFSFDKLSIRSFILFHRSMDFLPLKSKIYGILFVQKDYYIEMNWYIMIRLKKIMIIKYTMKLKLLMMNF